MHASILNMRLQFPFFVLVVAGFGAPFAVAGEKLPDVQVTSVRKVFGNGEHNAFTDLC